MQGRNSRPPPLHFSNGPSLMSGNILDFILKNLKWAISSFIPQENNMLYFDILRGRWILTNIK